MNETSQFRVWGYSFIGLIIGLVLGLISFQIVSSGIELVMFPITGDRQWPDWMEPLILVVGWITYAAVVFFCTYKGYKVAKKNIKIA